MVATGSEPKSESKSGLEKKTGYILGYHSRIAILPMTMLSAQYSEQQKVIVTLFFSPVYHDTFVFRHYTLYNA